MMETTSPPSDQPVVAEEASTETPAGEQEPQMSESAIFAEIASLINHSDIATILATQADMYPLFYHINAIIFLCIIYLKDKIQ